jgi:hypothetical protein
MPSVFQQNRPPQPNRPHMVAQGQVSQEKKPGMVKQFFNSFRQMSWRSFCFFLCFGVFGFALNFTSALTTKEGVLRVTGDKFMAYLVGFSLSGAIFAWYLIFGHMYPKAEFIYRDDLAKAKRVKFYLLLLFAFVVTPLMLGSSTILSAVFHGGVDAQSVHMQVEIESVETRRTAILTRLANDANHKLELEAFANQFQERAGDERGGVYSGMTGEGFAYRNYKSAASVFKSLADAVEAADKRAKEEDAKLVEYLDKARGNIMELRNAHSNAERDDVVAAYNGNMSQIGGHLIRMSQISTRGLLESANNNLGGLTTIVGEAPSEGQSRAVTSLSKVLGAAQLTVKSMLDHSVGQGQITIPTFGMISELRAIIKYWREVPYPIPIALALDLFEVVFVIGFAFWKDEKGEAKEKVEIGEHELALMEMQLRFDEVAVQQRALHGAQPPADQANTA